MMNELHAARPGPHPEVMMRRTRWIPVLLTAALGAAGCSDSYTIWMTGRQKAPVLPLPVSAAWAG